MSVVSSVGLAGLRERARAVLAADTFAYYDAQAGRPPADGAEAGEPSEWDDVRLAPRVLVDVSAISTATDVLGVPLASPVAVAPTALHGLGHPDGEVATATGARDAGCLYVASLRASRRMEDIAAPAGPWWQQIYVLGDRGVSDEVARRAAALGASALVLTVDTPMMPRRSASIPAGAPTTGIVEHLDGRDPRDPALQQARDVTAADITRLREASGLPVVAKGVLRGDQALRCLDAGASAVGVSAHGRRQLDGTVAVPHALGDVVAAVGDRAEVYVDGGVRTGVDVLRALALGARATLIGRPVLWGLALDGATGVRDVLRLMTDELSTSLTLAGCVSPADAGADLVAGQIRP